MREGAVAAFARQATAFETMADIYEPFYRQIDAGALAGMKRFLSSSANTKLRYYITIDTKSGTIYKND